METLIATYVFVLGLLVGSFVNVLVLRHEKGEGMGGRSHCGKCSRQLSWFENIPLLSFLALSGKCRTCRERISFQYPLVELLTASLYLLVWQAAFPLPRTILLLLATLFLVAIVIYDLRTTIIPDEFVIPWNLLAFLSVFVATGLATAPSVEGLLAGPLLAMPFAFLWAVSGGRWIGLGDAKLALGMGWFLGLVPGFSAVILSFWIGAITSLLILSLSKVLPHITKHLPLPPTTRHLTMKSEVPFAPFLVIGFYIGLLSQIDLFILPVRALGGF